MMDDSPRPLNRRSLLKAGLAAAAAPAAAPRQSRGPRRRPNLLLCIADDLSAAHLGCYGDPIVSTPVCDRIAREGVRFTNAFCAAPTCTASRGALLTGQAPARLGEGMNLWGALPRAVVCYTDVLRAAGYHVGCIGKGWGPGSDDATGRDQNPAGPGYRDVGAFLAARTPGAPLCLWFGSTDPHRPYTRAERLTGGRTVADVPVPPFLPDAPEVRADLLDYYAETERYDRDIGAIREALRERGEWDDTLAIVTSDNGLPFPRAKANLYDAGTRMPLLVRWPGRVPGGRTVSDFIDGTDLAPTILEALGLPPLPGATGRSLLPLLASATSGRGEAARDRAFFGRERHHPLARPEERGYPCRAVRTEGWLYVRNFAPDRAPAGDAPEYADIDGGPTKTYLLRHRDEPGVSRLFSLAAGPRPPEELYDLRADPHQMRNVADRPEHRAVRDRLRGDLDAWMKRTGDPRALRPDTDVFDRYPHHRGRREASGT